jgi:hypothetical protein
LCADPTPPAPEIQLPCPIPLEAAIEAGVFGQEPAGPVVPDSDDVAALTYEHACEMQALLADYAYLSRCQRLGVAPATGRPPRGDIQSSHERLAAEIRRTLLRYYDCLAVYEEAFGPDAAFQLDEHVRAAMAASPEKPPQVQQMLFDSP